MNAGQFASYAIAAASAIGALLAYFKFKPGQKEAVVITAAEANLNIAKGTINLISDEYESQFKRMRSDQEDLRNNLNVLRGQLDSYQEQARMLRNEVADLKAENSRLRNEVEQLRRENVRLRQGQNPEG